MVSPNYNCSQAELYTTCRNAWLLCLQYLSFFTDYKSKYIVAFINENLALITTVEAMDDYEARKAPVKVLRQDLGTEKADATVFYIRLKGYVTEAFKDDKTLLEATYTEIGKSYFDKLGSADSENVLGLFSAMLAVIRKHQAVLTTKGYMPDTFLTRIEEKQASYTAAQQSLDDGKKATPETNNVKVIANNDLKARAMAMLVDGQAVFCDNKPIAQKFVWTTLLAPVRGLKPMGFGGKVIDKATEIAPLSIVTASIDSLNKTVICDKDGRYQFVVPSTGKHTVTFRAEGYVTLVEEREVKTGVMGRLNVVLEAAA